MVLSQISAIFLGMFVYGLSNVFLLFLKAYPPLTPKKFLHCFFKAEVGKFLCYGLLLVGVFYGKLTSHYGLFFTGLITAQLLYVSYLMRYGSAYE